MELYSNKHPNTTMKGTGFMDEKKAIKTLKIIKYRSPKYQYDVINTMYNRAKYHPNQTSGMKKAMKIFKDWIKKYKNEKVKYKYLPLDEIKKYGVESDFTKKLEEVNGKYYKLQYIPIGKYDYLSYRDFLLKKLYKKKLFHKNGKITKSHLKMISLGYSPIYKTKG